MLDRLMAAAIELAMIAILVAIFILAAIFALDLWELWFTQRQNQARSTRTQGGTDPMTRVEAFLAEEFGVTAIEYALIASLIALIIVVSVQLVGTQVSAMFTEVGNSLK